MRGDLQRIGQPLQSGVVRQQRRIAEPAQIAPADQVGLPLGLQPGHPTPRKRVARGTGRGAASFGSDHQCCGDDLSVEPSMPSRVFHGRHMNGRRTKLNVASQWQSHHCMDSMFLNPTSYHFRSCWLPLAVLLLGPRTCPLSALSIFSSR